MFSSSSVKVLNVDGKVVAGSTTVGAFPAQNLKSGIVVLVGSFLSFAFSLSCSLPGGGLISYGSARCRGWDTIRPISVIRQDRVNHF